MKVLLVGYKLSLGIDLYMDMLYRGLSAKGVETYCAGDRNYSNPGPHFFPISNGGGKTALIKDALSLGGYRAFRDVLRQVKPDVVFFVGAHPMNFISALICRKVCPGTYIMSHIHDPTSHSGAGWMITVFGFISQITQCWASHLTIVAGETLRTEVHRYYGLPLERIQVVHFPAHRDEALMDPRAPEGSKTYLAVLGRIEDYKGVDVFLEAASILLEDPERFPLPSGLKFLVGGGGDMAKYQKLIEKLPTDRVDIRNYIVPNEEFDEILRNSFACVLPYRDGTMTLFIQVAYFHGCPVLVTRVGSLPELVVEGETGRVAPPSDPQALAEAMHAFVRDPEDRLRMGRQAQAYCTENLTWSQTAEYYVRFWKATLGKA